MLNKYNVTVHVDNVNLTGRVGGQVKNPPINDDGDKLKNLESELASQNTLEAELKSLRAELVYLRKMDEVVMQGLGIEGTVSITDNEILDILRSKLACTEGVAKYKKQSVRMKGVNDAA